MSLRRNAQLHRDRTYINDKNYYKMTKKTYIAPTITVVNIECKQMLADSKFSNDPSTNQEITVGGEFDGKFQSNKGEGWNSSDWSE